MSNKFFYVFTIEVLNKNKVIDSIFTADKKAADKFFLDLVFKSEIEFKYKKEMMLESKYLKLLKKNYQEENRRLINR